MYTTDLKINRPASGLNEYIGDDKGLIVGSNIERKCSKCKTYYLPTKNDISTKRPTTYYKSCFNCRKKMQDYLKNYYEKKGLDKKYLPPEIII